MQTDINSTASGSFQRQNTAAFSNPAIAGGYVFDFSGVSAAFNPESIIGRFSADGGGGINSGLFDSNEAGTLSGQQPFPAGAFYQLDTNGNGTNFGRGTANIAGHNFAFYIVDSTRLKLLGTDSSEAFSGEAFAQQNISFTDCLTEQRICVSYWRRQFGRADRHGRPLHRGWRRQPDVDFPR